MKWSVQKPFCENWPAATCATTREIAREIARARRACVGRSRGAHGWRAGPNATTPHHGSPQAVAGEVEGGTTGGAVRPRPMMLIG